MSKIYKKLTKYKMPLFSANTVAKFRQMWYNLLCIIDFITEMRFMGMDLEMVKYLSKLGKLNFTDDELKKAAEDMTSIIEIMDTIKEIDIVYEPIKDNHNVYLDGLRRDEAMDSFPTEKILQNAVNSESCFVVPKVVE